MKAYVYRAALYCEDCANALQDQICRETHSSRESMDNGDSDTWPQGPFADGGGEADVPQHCDSCGTFLENPLTANGDAYVRRYAAQFEAADSDQSWDDVAQMADSCGNAVVADWIRFYLAASQ